MEPILQLSHPESTVFALTVHLAAAESGSLPLCGRAIHAQVLDWFRHEDPEASEALHNSQESPLSLSGLISQRPKTKVKEGDEFYIRIGLLNGRLLEPLLSSLEKIGNKPFFLAKFPFVIRSINMIPGTNPWVAISDYALLVKLPYVLDTLTLKFLSPTSFKVNAGQGIQQFPFPEAVFGNLYRRWNAFAPETLKFSKPQWSGLVSDYELKSEKLWIDQSYERGAVGWVKYRFVDPEQARIATILAHFAYFAGVGRKTTMGMGQVVLD